jgi:hypothetical protein
MRVIRKVLGRGRFFAVLLFQRFWSVAHVECARWPVFFVAVNISTTDVWRQCRLSFRASLHIASEVAIVLQARSAARPQGAKNNFSLQNSGIPRIFSTSTVQPRDTLPYCLRRHISCRYLCTSTYYSLLSAFSDLDPPTQVHPGHEDHPTDESATTTRLATPWAKLSTSLDLYPWQSGDKDPAPLSCDSPTRDAGRQYASENV